MGRAIFEYTKTVLEKVSFSTDLFKKELEKAVKTLLPYEINELYYWLRDFTINKPELYSCIAIVQHNKRSF